MNSTLENIKKNTEIMFKVLIGLASAYYIGLFLYISISRFSFPINFDWVEGAVLVQIHRLLLGQQLYVEPSVNYIPLVYQPLYFYIAALFSMLFGFGFGSARLVSILATSGCITIIFLITRKETGANFPGLISAGLFAATYNLVWMWFDLAKVDMLSIFLSLFGFYFLLNDNSHSAILAGIFFALSFLTKQSALIVMLPIFVFYFWIDRKATSLCMMICSLVTMAGMVLFNYTSNGWYWYYAFTLPSNHRLDGSLGQIEYIVTSLLQPVWLFCGIWVLALFTNTKKLILNRRYLLFLASTFSILALSIISALSIGSTRNALIPAYVLIAILSGISLHHLFENITIFFSGSRKFISIIMVFGICLLQFSMLQYKTRSYIPSAQDFKQANALIKRLRDTDGDFLIPTENYLAIYAGKKVYYHHAPFGELTGWFGNTMPEATKVALEIQQDVQSGEIDFVYWTDPSHEWAGLSCEKIETLRSQSKFVPKLYKLSCH